MTDADDRLDGLARTLGVGLIVREVEVGPPARVVATALLDGASTQLEGSGATEDAAWEDLARALIAWRRDDGRNIRTYVGGV